MLAPVGLVAVPISLVKKSRSDRRDALTGLERDMLNRVPLIGADLLWQIPRLKNVARIIRYQNKNFDESGHPLDSVSRSEIPIGSRILRVLTELVEAGPIISIRRLSKALPKFSYASNRRGSKAELLWPICAWGKCWFSPPMTAS